ncbi:hypothetical protein O181_077716 [Austropuccinia psidii MF-1]|uniref:Uncharacterized protein n=1 Tax=Austropuccinia psidii MF-1 TaxID=1389203 RepID=A0A9Q3ICC9_9BASI|nr:hypothetical protein [Austropuccinia psidii MF-1]
MVEISNGHFNIPTYHHMAPNHSEDSSRLKSNGFSVKDQSRHQDVIGKFHSHYSVKTILFNHAQGLQEAVHSFIHSFVKCQSSTQSILATTFISIHSGSIKNCISFSSMGNSINPFQFQYYPAVSIPKTINTASRINKDQFPA